jgi:hypothetical protein
VQEFKNKLNVRNHQKIINMKKSVVLFGIALVSLTHVCTATNVTSFIHNSLAQINISNVSTNMDHNNADKNAISDELIEPVRISKMKKTADQLIAEDNAVTENTISNETQPLNFDLINKNLISDEVIEPVSVSKMKKTADQLIAEDNAITENTIFNETQPLNFDLINKNVIGNTI